MPTTAQEEIYTAHQENASPGADDFITVLTSKGPLLAKQWVQENGQTKSLPYDRAKTFDAAMVPVTNLTELAGVLDNLNSTEAVIYGALSPEFGKRANNISRLLFPRGENDPATITEAAHFWVLLDVDGLVCPAGFDPVIEPERAAAHVICLLPEEFDVPRTGGSLQAQLGLSRGYECGWHSGWIES
jgi:hypothetical protein